MGTLYLVFAGEALRGIDFKKPTETLRKGVMPALMRTELQEFFKRGKENFIQKIDIEKGTEFEKKVWLALREIPFGETRSYKWLAERVGTPKGSRAVGQALSKNPLPIILPCHRVIESDGSLGGYSGGVDIKRRLLDIEYYMQMGKKNHPSTSSG